MMTSMAHVASPAAHDNIARHTAGKTVGNGIAAATAGMVYVVDDEASVCDALSSLLRSAGFDALTFSSPEDFLRYRRDNIPGCLVLDVRLHGESGLSLQETIVKDHIPIPIIFMTAHGDVEMSVRAMKAGAMDFFIKPFRAQDMLDAVARGLATDRVRLAKCASLWQARTRYDLLTPREHDVVQHVLQGRLNKQIAAELNLSEITVKIHRGRAMKKMAVASVAELVRIVDALEPRLEPRVEPR
jgi:FixJ family two-component response regulator